MGEQPRINASEQRLSSLERRQYIIQAVDKIMIGGYVLEFGVGKGTSLRCIADVTQKRVFGFDSFEGLPEEWSPSPHVIFAKGSFKYDPPEQLPNNVELVQGWFVDTIPVWKKVNFGPVAFLHVDSDLYSSCKTILTELSDQIKPGTILLFDELFDYLDWENGEWKALQEWLEENNREVYELSTYGTQATYRVIK